MGMKDRNYWIERAKDKVIWDAEQTDQVTKELMLIYDETANEVEDRILALYQKFARDNELTPDQAKQLISGKEFSIWRKSLKGYLKDISADATNSKILLELNTLAMKSRISREEKLLAEVYRSMAEMAQDTETNLTELLADATTSDYYRSCYNLQVGMGVGFEVAKIDKTVIQALVTHPWAEKTFSKAIWDDVDEICDHVRRAITRGFVAGSGAEKITKDLQEVTEKGRKVVERLVRTEYKYFANQGELLGYIENGITKYVFMGGTEGIGACHCAFYNNKIIAVDKAKPGVNFPPLHPNCLCTVRAYFDNSILDNKDWQPLEEGISLEEWQEKFVKEKKKPKIKLTPEEEHALKSYISSEAYPLNEKLRDGRRLSREDKKLIRNLDSALDKMPNYKGTVYRSVSEFGIEDIDEFVSGYTVGQSICFPSYISTGEKIYDDSFPIQYVIDCENGKDIQGYNQNEEEVLFQRNTAFVVMQKRGSTIYLKEID